MTALAFVTRLREAGVDLSVEDGQLRCRAAPGILTSELVAELRSRKDEVVMLLRDVATSRNTAWNRIEAAPADAPPSLSPAQERLWLLQQVEGGNAYNIPIMLRLEGSLDAEALRGAVTALADRHDVLRSRFTLHGGECRAEAGPKGAFGVLLCERDEAEALGEAEALILRPFELDAEPPLRAALFRIGAEVHLLALCLHHIVADGRTLAILMDEVAQDYDQLRQGAHLLDRPLRLQYRDYARWLRDRAAEGRFEEGRRYWAERLHGLPPRLDLPVGPVPGQSPRSGSEVAFTIPPALARDLRDLARTAQATVFNVLSAVFSVLLGRYVNQTDVALGAPVVNRWPDDTQSMVGLFANTVVLRTDLSDDPTFADLLGRVRDDTLAAIAHQHVPFEQVVADSAQRNAGETPLFQAMISMQPVTAADLRLPGIRCRQLRPSSPDAKFALTLTVEEEGNGYLGRLEYRADLLAGPLVRDMADRYVMLLDKAARAPFAPVSTLPLTGDADLTALRATARAGRRPLADPRPLHLVFAEQARRTPGRTAAAGPSGRSLSYGELDRAANRLARLLIARGVRPGDTVGLCLHPEPDMITAVLATLKAGAAYLPLDPSYPRERLDMMVGDADPAALVTTRILAGALFPDRAEALCLDDEAASLAMLPDDDPDVPTDPRSPIYLIYTSGSTGRPKAAVVHHAGFANLVDWYRRTYDFGLDSRVLLVSALSFDLTQKNLFAPLLGGGTLVFPEAAPFDPRRLAETIGRHAITSINCTPTTFHELIEATASTGHRALGSLRQVFLGGEPINTGRLRNWALTRGDATVIVNSYGPTECADVCAAYDLPTHPDDWSEPVPIGRALPNTQLLILDGANRPLPDGAIGQLAVGGVGVGLGYHRRPELTAERFLPNPHEDDPDGRLYLTGDLARVRADGEIVFLGRADQQVKVRGYRIELSEIEAVLSSHPAIRNAAATVQETGRGEGRLVAFAVPADGAPFDARSIRDWLRGKLPPWQVPAVIAALEMLPLTPSGKVDRRALPFAQSAAMDEEGYEPPETATESRLAGIWTEVLDVVRVGRKDDFFELGGHSLLAVRIIARMEEALGVCLPISALFDNPRLCELAAVADEGGGRGGASDPEPDLPLVPRPDATVAAPLSFAQQRLWFLSRLQPDDTSYNMTAALALDGPLDTVALEGSLQRILDRHTVLTVRFQQAGDDVLQLPSSGHRLRLSPEDIAPDAVPDAIRAFAERPFDLSSELPVRVRLLRAGPDRHAFLISLHHAVCDGWSVGLLRRELAEGYNSAVQGRPAALPPLSVQYPDYAAWQRSCAGGSRHARQIAYWEERLRGLPEISSLPTDYPRPDEPAHEGAVIPFSVPADVASSLREMAGSRQASLFMVLAGAFAATLARLSGSEEAVFGTPVANRPRPELEPLIGCFLNALVLRVPVAGAQTFLDLLDRARRALLEAHANRDVPFEQLVDRLKPARSLTHPPLFQIQLVQDENAGTPDLHGLAVRDLRPAVPGAKYDFNVHVSDQGDRIDGYVEYATELFTPATARRLADCFAHVLLQVAANPSLPLDDLSLLPETQAALLASALAEELEKGLPRDACIHHLIEAQAAHTPHAPAIELEGSVLDYAGLMERSGRLAGDLRGLGVGPDVPVAVLMDRSIERAVALVAILRAGGAYVPLDPDFPDARLAHIVADAGCAALLCDRPGDVARLDFAGPALDLDAQGRARSDGPGIGGDMAAGPDHLAYIMYTSGSTGRPKGVLVPHRGVAHDLAFLVRKHGLGPGDRILQMTAYTFDPSVRDLFATLSAGATAIVVPPEEAKDPPALLRRLARERITRVLSLTPTMLRALVAAGERDRDSWRDGRHFALRSLMLNGERLTSRDCRLAHELFGPQVTIVNQYGPTEATMTSATRIVTPHDLKRIRIPVGRPNPSTRIHVLDGAMRPVAPGVFGEIYIEGIGITRGYANDQDRTAAAFIANSFSDDPARSRLYRSGDVGRYLEDGSLDLLGRTDFQLKVAGNRVELGEIEARLLEHPEVAGAGVVPHADPDGSDRLVAYVVGRGAEIPPSLLREHLARSLPAYMIPSTFVMLDRLPLTATGKLDRRALPAPSAFPAPSPLRPAAPAGGMEARIAAIWSEALGTPVTDTDTSFFDLGGTSLALMKVQQAIRDRLDRDVRIVELFRHPTLSSLARFLTTPPDLPEPQRAAGRTPAAPSPGTDRIARRRAALRSRVGTPHAPK